MIVDGCPFCEIVTGSDTELIRVWPDALAFEPLNPVVPGHLLVIPRTHVPDFTFDPIVSATVMARAAKLAAECFPCNLITSAGELATQTIRHLHIHIVPRRPGDGLTLPWTGQEH